VDERLQSTRLCEGCLLERLSGPDDYANRKARTLYAHKQASESSQDAAEQLGRGLRGEASHHRGVGEVYRGARGQSMTRRRFSVAEAATLRP
jgi:hypothetical protein